MPQAASQYHQRVGNQTPLRQLAEPRVFARNAGGLDTTFVIAQYLGHYWGGIRKAETEVVRIKGRRRDKGGGGWEKQISRVGGLAPYFFSFFHYVC